MLHAVVKYKLFGVTEVGAQETGEFSGAGVVEMGGVVKKVVMACKLRRAAIVQEGDVLVMADIGGGPDGRGPMLQGEIHGRDHDG
jgi:hypothetical protein